MGNNTTATTFNNQTKFILELNGKEIFYGTLAECKAFEIKLNSKSFEDIFNKTYYVPQIERVIFKNPATIVFWADGDKTVVKSDDVDGYYEHIGLATAIVKKAFGGRSKWVKHVRDLQKKINELPMTDCKFDEFDLMLHYTDKLYTEKKFSDMVEKHMRKNYRVTE